MTEGLNWDEFRIIKAIAETHTLAAAGERLGLNHSTMFRRLTALEARLKVRLFERERSGYRPTAAGEDMIALAVLMGQTIEEFQRRVTGEGAKLSGVVRLTSVNSIGCLILPPIVAALLSEHPSLHLELLLEETPLDLERGEADLALRSLKGPLPGGLAGRRIAALPWAIYAASSLITDDFQALSAPWISPSESFGPAEARRWLDRNVDMLRRVATASSDIAMSELAARGVGVALLPCYVGAAKPELRRVGKPDADLDRELWLVAHPQTLRIPRVRALYDFIGDELERNRHLFEDEPTPDGGLG
jgi:DNA-binding transcriptional LysR family regulator